MTDWHRHLTVFGFILCGTAPAALAVSLWLSINPYLVWSAFLGALWLAYIYRIRREELQREWHGKGFDDGLWASRFLPDEEKESKGPPK